MCCRWFTREYSQTQVQSEHRWRRVLCASIVATLKTASQLKKLVFEHKRSISNPTEHSENRWLGLTHSRVAKQVSYLFVCLKASYCLVCYYFIFIFSFLMCYAWCVLFLILCSWTNIIRFLNVESFKLDFIIKRCKRITGVLIVLKK